MWHSWSRERAGRTGLNLEPGTPTVRTGLNLEPGTPIYCQNRVKAVFKPLKRVKPYTITS